MKRSNFLMAAAFVLAIGSAYAFKSIEVPGYVGTGPTDCVPADIDPSCSSANLGAICTDEHLQPDCLDQLFRPLP